MIKKIVGTVFLLLVGAGLMYYCLANHFVKTDTGTLRVPKAALTLSDTWVDIREWEAKDFNENREVTKALVDNGHGDLVVQSAAGGVLDWLKGKANEVLEKDEQ